MKKLVSVGLAVLFFVSGVSLVQAEDLKISGDLSLAASFNNPENYEDSKLNFSYFQLYAEKKLQDNLSLYLSVVVNTKDSDGNNYEADYIVDTAFAAYKFNEFITFDIGREIINYGYQNPISVIDNKFAVIPEVNNEYFGGYVLRGDGIKAALRNSVVDADVAYYNIPTDNSLKSKSLFARISKTFCDSLTVGANVLASNGPDKTDIKTDNIIVYGPDVKYKNEFIEFESELMFVNRKTDFNNPGKEESVDRLGFYSQLTGNILSGNKLYAGARLDYTEPFTAYDKSINKYVSGVAGSYIYDNLLVRIQYRTNIDEGKDTLTSLLATVTF